jgi:hypothetical protein
VLYSIAVIGSIFGINISINTIASALTSMGFNPYASLNGGHSSSVTNNGATVNSQTPSQSNGSGSYNYNDLPSNPNDLVNQGWTETTHPQAAANSNTRTFVNELTGQTVRFDTAVPGVPGFRGKDHYHIVNPNSTGDNNYYLDINGNPVPKGSNPSHIIP